MLDGCVPWPQEFIGRYQRAGYWRGQTLGDIVRGWARTDGQRVAVADEDRCLTYAEIDLWADRLAAGLRRIGIRAGDRVVVQLPNLPEFVVLSLALFRLGTPPVFALPSHRSHEIKYLCEYTEAVAYVIPDAYHGFDHRALAEEVRSCMPALRHVLVVGQPGQFLALEDVAAEPESLLPPSPQDVAFFLLSGGTTSLPKLIPRTHDDYAYQLRATAEGLGFDEHGIYLAALPIAHNAALGCPGVLGALFAGGRVVLASSPNPGDVFPLIEIEGVTLTTLISPLVVLWIKAAELFGVRFPRLLLQVGGAMLDPGVGRRVYSTLGCAMTHWFGMAEGLLSFTRPDDPQEIVIHTQGRPLSPADELRVVDEHDQDVPPGEVGQLLARGPYTLRGYYKDPKYNATAFTADGYLRTGDMVKITAAGDMVVTGRIKDVINRGGEKVSVEEVETHLLAHPGVRSIAVVAMPDATLGEKACAFVVPQGDGVTLAELKRFLVERGVADYKQPDGLKIVESLPRTNLGKINKAALREAIAREVREQEANT
jgi:2,3-dihydroxybenzoate-AMP ligase